MADLSIRPATVADVAAIAAAEQRCFSDPWSEEGIAGLFESQSLLGLVAWGSGANPALAGYLLARSIAGEAEILTLAVVPERRGTGVGRGLLVAALAGLRERGTQAVFLEVRESNTAAGRLYAAQGFRPVGVRSDYYRSPRENAVVLRLEVSQ